VRYRRSDERLAWWQRSEYASEMKCPRRSSGDVTLVSQALTRAFDESHTEQCGAKLEHGKELNVVELRETVLNGRQSRWFPWGTWVSAGESPLWITLAV
jgi:hypothetical protein